MPQIDIATFLPQAFWLVTVFIVFYLIVLGYILPSFSAILKIRAKKLNQGKEIFLLMDTQKNNLNTSFSQIILDTSKKSTELIKLSSGSGFTWIDNSLTATHSKPLNNSFIEEIAQSNTNKNILSNITLLLVLSSYLI